MPTGIRFPRLLFIFIVHGKTSVPIKAEITSVLKGRL